MFTKIKAAFLSLIHPFIARLYEMSIETQVVAAAETAEADAAALFHDAITDVKETLEKAEALIVPAAAAAVAAIPVLDAVQPRSSRRRSCSSASGSRRACRIDHRHHPHQGKRPLRPCRS